MREMKYLCPSINGERLSQELQVPRLSQLCVPATKGSSDTEDSPLTNRPKFHLLWMKVPWESVCMKKYSVYENGKGIRDDSGKAPTYVHLVAGFSFRAFDVTKMDLPSFFLFFSSSLHFCFLFCFSCFPRSNFLNSGLRRLIVGFAFKWLGQFLRLSALTRSNILRTFFFQSSFTLKSKSNQIKVLWGPLRLFWVPVIPSQSDSVWLLFLFS